MNATEKACIAIQQNPTAELEMVSRSQKGAIRRIHGDSHFNEMARYIQLHSGSTMEDLKAQFKNTGPVIGAVRKVVQRLPEKFQIKQVEGIKSAPVKNKKAKIAKKLEAIRDGGMIARVVLDDDRYPPSYRYFRLSIH